MYKYLGGRLISVSFHSRLKSYVDLVDNRLREILPLETERPELLHLAMRHSCLAAGKRMRPVLVMAGAEAVGGTGLDVVDAACAVELIHCFSLIHDDLPALDDDDLRRGLPTCHKVFGEAVAILAGDALFALAFHTLGNGVWDAEKKISAILLLTQATGSEGLVGGETIDILSERQEVDFETLKVIHARKTGALIAASCEIGAILSGASGDQAKQLYAYGQAIGLAFQIADDLLNETSTPEALGKAAGSDRARGKATYPSLFGIEVTRQMAKDAAEHGIACLDGVPNKDFLVSIANYSIERLH